jgi:hypothetical protein
MVLSAAGAATAAFIAEGQGSTTSTETTGAGGSAPVTVTANNLNDSLVPGSNPGTIDVTITNPSTTTDVQVSNFVVAVTGTSNSGCTAADFTVTQATAWGPPNSPAGPLPVDIPPGGMVEATFLSHNGPTIGLISTAPTACEGVTVNLSETAS